MVAPKGKMQVFVSRFTCIGWLKFAQAPSSVDGKCGGAKRMMTLKALLALRNAASESQSSKSLRLRKQFRLKRTRTKDATTKMKRLVGEHGSLATWLSRWLGDQNNHRRQMTG